MWAGLQRDQDQRSISHLCVGSEGVCECVSVGEEFSIVLWVVDEQLDVLMGITV